MIRLFQILIALSLLSVVVCAENETENSSAGYIIQELVIFSFDEEFSPEMGNITEIQDDVPVDGNETELGGEMTARKLFEMKEAAKADYWTLRNLSNDFSTGLSPTASQGLSIICKQCIPIKKEE